LVITTAQEDDCVNKGFTNCATTIKRKKRENIFK